MSDEQALPPAAFDVDAPAASASANVDAPAPSGIFLNINAAGVSGLLTPKGYPKRGIGKKGQGRPSTCTPELTEAICVRLRLGNYLEVAAAAEGVNRDTLFSWFRRARDGNRTFLAFITAANAAIAVGEGLDLESIDRGAKGDWRAAAWRLERRASRRWGKAEPESDPLTPPDAVVVASEGHGRLASKLAELDSDALVRLTDSLLGAPGTQAPRALPAAPIEADTQPDINPPDEPAQEADTKADTPGA